VSDYDSRFDDAEAEVDRGESWRFREEGVPNPLTLKVTGWSSGHTRHGEAEFLIGTDRAGKKWSVLVGATVLRRRLIDGEVSEWDEERQAFVVVRVDGRAAVGDVVSIMYLGDRDTGDGATYAAFDVVRKPPVNQPPSEADTESPGSAPEPEADSDSGQNTDDDIPF
jgi:hypothetical protein